MTEEQLATIPVEDAGTRTPNGPGDLDVVRIYHAGLQQFGESPRAGVKYLDGWEVVEPTPEEAAQVTDYDPAGHSATEVVAFLEGADDAQREAVIALERDGKSRKTITDWTPPTVD